MERLGAGRALKTSSVRSILVHPNYREDVFITPENERKVGCADEGGASIANDALRTSAYPTPVFQKNQR
jgi:hypothetical protein